MPHNVYYTRYHFYCDHCVCRYCAAPECPAGRRPGHNDYDFCIESRDRGACPRFDCDFFVNRKLQVRRFAIKRKEPTIWMLAERLYRIEKLLDQIVALQDPAEDAEDEVGKN